MWRASRPQQFGGRAALVFNGRGLPFVGLRAFVRRVAWSEVLGVPDGRCSSSPVVVVVVAVDAAGPAHLARFHVLRVALQ